MGVEAALRVQDDTGTFASILELKNGCVCCSVRSDFATAIEKLLSQRSFDYVIVECSGIADPGQLASSLWLDNELESRIFLDAVVAVVDATTVRGHLRQEQSHSPLILRQLAHADCILLNKVDLINAASNAEDTLESLEAEIRMINAGAPIIRTVRSRIPLDRVLDLKAYVGSRAVEELAEGASLAFKQKSEHTCSPSHEGPCDHDHDHEHVPAHGSTAEHKDENPHGISTLVLEIESVGLGDSENARKLSLGVDVKALKVWLTEELWSELQNSNAFVRENLRAEAVESAKEAQARVEQELKKQGESQVVFRIKGVLAAPDEPHKLYLQGVQQLFDVDFATDQFGTVSTHPADMWPDNGEPRVSRVIVIGRNLRKNTLKERFRQCFLFPQ